VRLPLTAHIKREDGKSILSQLGLHIEKVDIVICSVSIGPMDDNERTIEGMLSVGENPRDEPATQLHMIITAGKRDIGIRKAQISGSSRNGCRFLCHQQCRANQANTKIQHTCYAR